ncbi:MAG: ATP-binding protein [Rhodothermales bacterium]|nr:ATP-binding protein [Rhodothermales bacterium]
MKGFRIQCALRVIMLACTILAGIYGALTYASLLLGGVAAVLTGGQLISLIRFVDRTNRELSRLLLAIRYSDFSQAFHAAGLGGSFSELGQAFTAVMEDFRKARAEKEEHVLYLNTVIQHIGIGLLAFQQQGSIGLINNAAKRLLRVPYLKNVRALGDFSVELVETLLGMHAGDKALVKVVDGDELLELVMYATEFRLHGQLYTLVSIQDIQAELEEKEIQSWQKLVSVLTHEIMNSITPIASMADTANDLLRDLAPNGPADEARETLDDVHMAMQTIARRSQHLLHFVNAYRSLTRIPRPNLGIFPIHKLFGAIEHLFRTSLEEARIALEISIDPVELDVTADPELIEQVLINLIKNAIEALRGRPDARIALIARMSARGRTVIQVRDNGPGIPPEAVDRIFIPFYTTKKEGSGIGLSLSRQIMRQHGGALSVVSEPDLRTTFTLRF